MQFATPRRATGSATCRRDILGAALSARTMTRLAAMAFTVSSLSGAPRGVHPITPNKYGKRLIAAFTRSDRCGYAKVELAMRTFEFTLIFALADAGADPSRYIDALFEEGCDDAVLGVGRHGAIALDFCRESNSADEAMKSAKASVERAIPGAKLIEVKPDLVNLSDIAAAAGCSRQNVQKYAIGDIKGVQAPFPLTAFTGSQNLWHLYEVAEWFTANTDLGFATELVEASRVASSLNVEAQIERVIRNQDLPSLLLARRLSRRNSPVVLQMAKPAKEAQNPFRALRPDVKLTPHQETFEPAFSLAG